MNKITRRILFWLFVALFFLIAPLISFYAFGYYFDFTTFKVIKTGSIYVASLPSSALVFVDGKYQDTTPALVKRLKPGPHKIEVKADNRFSWEKTFLISPYQVAEARNIFLPLKNPLIQLQPDITSLGQLIAPEETKSKEQFARDLQNSNIQAQDIKIRNGNGYFIKDPGSMIFTKNLSSDEQPKQVSPTNILTDGVKQNMTSRLILGGSQEIALLGADQKLYLLNKETKELQFIQAGVLDASFSPDETKLFLLTDNEIFVYYLEPTAKQPFHLKGDKVFLIRLSSPIISASWYAKSNDYLLFSIADKIKMIEIDDRDNHNIFDLIPASQTKLFNDPKDGKQYFESKNQVFSLELE